MGDRTLREASDGLKKKGVNKWSKDDPRTKEDKKKSDEE